MPPSKNAPRFLDYRRSPLPLDVALSFALPPPRNDRRSARALVLAGRVRANGATQTDCSRLVRRRGDRLALVARGAGGTEEGTATGERPVGSIARPRYFACYKPRGVTCSSGHEETERGDAVLMSEWLAGVTGFAGGVGGNDDVLRGVFPARDADLNGTACDGEAGASRKAIETVGRLDKESEGLILLTNDGSFSRLLCDPEFGLRKTYRIVVRGSTYTRTIAGAECCPGVGECDDHDADEDATEKEPSPSSIKDLLAQRVKNAIQRGNLTPGTVQHPNARTRHGGGGPSGARPAAAAPRFPYESCRVLDAGRLPAQHPADATYYALVDLVLREGRRHAVRRLARRAGLRVLYLSRVAVEGLEGACGAVRPRSLAEAAGRGFCAPDGGGGPRGAAVPAGTRVSPSRHGEGPASAGAAGEDPCSTMLLRPGDVMELRECDVDRIFNLRKAMI